MLAVDTSVVVRCIVRDDEAQSKRARAIVSSGSIFLSPAVILESEWVLSGLYGFSGAEATDALEAFCGLPGVEVGEADAVKRAFDLVRTGLDLADALHLAQAAECEAFVTFDRRLEKRAKRSNLSVKLA